MRRNSFIRSAVVGVVGLFLLTSLEMAQTTFTDETGKLNALSETNAFHKDFVCSPKK